MTMEDQRRALKLEDSAHQQSMSLPLSRAIGHKEAKGSFTSTPRLDS
jgi:hypothetical protein